MKDSNYKQLITVGDITTSRFLKSDINPDIAIIDYSVKRDPVDDDTKRDIENFNAPSIKVENPPGHITKELDEALEKAVLPLKLIVEGEEDLATLPAAIHAPLGSIVAYGQPNQGLVIIEVTQGKKKEFRELLNLFEND